MKLPSQPIAPGSLVTLAVVFAFCAHGRSAPAPPSLPLDPATLIAHNVKAETADYLGRKSVRLTVDSPSNNGGAGFAVLPGTDFQDGTIEADLAVKITTPPGVRMPGFIGIAFRIKPDASEYEVFYLRPKNALAGDQAMRNHAVQYCAEPDSGWYRLRREWPFVYESYADIQPETWIHLRIVVAGRAAQLYLNGSPKPALLVDGLKSANLHGGIALWGYAGEESYFSNVRVTPSPPAPIRNGSDAAGTWDVHFSSDAGRFDGSLKLARDGNKLSGNWTGAFGENQPISGTWRDGFIRLSFDGEWPKSSQDGAPGPVTVFLEGWIDDASAGGRMRVAGRADGPWTAERTAQRQP
jgi:hypothetical protein